ncbi:MAG: hypothetical protein IPM53_32070 [Anaerolineaceae bacterium]|nr:hypothetical protein [Anaerolineaceae bacterium]
MTQTHRLTMAIVAGNLLFTNATLGCVAATFNRNNEFTVLCVLGSKHINLRNI